MPTTTPTKQPNSYLDDIAKVQQMAIAAQQMQAQQGQAMQQAEMFASQQAQAKAQSEAASQKAIFENMNKGHIFDFAGQAQQQQPQQQQANPLMDFLGGLVKSVHATDQVTDPITGMAYNQPTPWMQLLRSMAATEAPGVSKVIESDLAVQNEQRKIGQELWKSLKVAEASKDPNKLWESLITGGKYSPESIVVAKQAGDLTKLKELPKEVSGETVRHNREMEDLARQNAAQRANNPESAAFKSKLATTILKNPSLTKINNSIIAGGIARNTAQKGGPLSVEVIKTMVGKASGDDRISNYDVPRYADKDWFDRAKNLWNQNFVSKNGEPVKGFKGMTEQNKQLINQLIDAMVETQKEEALKLLDSEVYTQALATGIPYEDLKGVLIKKYEYYGSKSKPEDTAIKVISKNADGTVNLSDDSIVSQQEAEKRKLPKGY